MAPMTISARMPPIWTVEDLRRHLFITYVDDLLYTPALDYGRELAAAMPRRFECGSMVGQMEAVRAGTGVAILHDYAAQRVSRPDPHSAGAAIRAQLLADFPSRHPSGASGGGSAPSHQRRRRRLARQILALGHSFHSRFCPERDNFLTAQGAQLADESAIHASQCSGIMPLRARLVSSGRCKSFSKILFTSSMILA